MSIMMAQMGLSFAQDLGGFMSAGIAADMQRAMQAYNNTMASLSAARQKNAITVNEIRTQDAAVRSNVQIDFVAMQDQAKAKVAAATAGVAGGSVEAVMNDLKSSAAKAKYTVSRQTNEAMAELGEQRKTVSLNAIAGKDIQVIPQPSIGSALLGAGTNMLSIYDSWQPDGSKLLEYRK